jgi:aminoglycoside phosphotransferase (APT) family kinase protein
MLVCARKMHADEVDTDVPLVRRLLATQFPQWADLPIEPVPSAEPDNAIYRLGAGMAVRLPRVEAAMGQGARVAAETRPAPAARPSLVHVEWCQGIPAIGIRRQRG